MSEKKYRNKYRIQSARAPWHDYGGGMYFVTICTAKIHHCFGEITPSGNGQNEMHLSEIGEYVEEQIKISSQMRRDMHVTIPLYVIMPNHVHLIIYIGQNQYNTDAYQCRDAMHCVSTTLQNRFGPQRKNLASIIRGIKSSVTKYANEHDLLYFGWQPRFHDHIIRSVEEQNRIADYIQNNVAKWDTDCFYENNDQL